MFRRFPNNGGSKHLQNVNKFQPDYTVQNPRSRSPFHWLNTNITHILMVGKYIRTVTIIPSWAGILMPVTESRSLQYITHSKPSFRQDKARWTKFLCKLELKIYHSINPCIRPHLWLRSFRREWYLGFMGLILSGTWYFHFTSSDGCLLFKKEWMLENSFKLVSRDNKHKHCADINFVSFLRSKWF
jgi:hypothetical protein